MPSGIRDGARTGTMISSIDSASRNSPMTISTPATMRTNSQASLKFPAMKTEIS